VAEAAAFVGSERLGREIRFLCGMISALLIDAVLVFAALIIVGGIALELRCGHENARLLLLKYQKPVRESLVFAGLGIMALQQIAAFVSHHAR
jgi:hypothetical protein